MKHVTAASGDRLKSTDVAGLLKFSVFILLLSKLHWESPWFTFRYEFSTSDQLMCMTYEGNLVIFIYILINKEQIYLIINYYYYYWPSPHPRTTSTHSQVFVSILSHTKLVMICKS